MFQPPPHTVKHKTHDSEQKEEEEEEDPYVTQLSECSDIYLKLETCLAEHDRDWRRCQTLVKSLQDCNQKQGP